MVVSQSDNVMNILKIWYLRNGVSNLLFRNSPITKECPKEKVEGKEYRYAAIYGRGGAVSANYNTAKAAAIETARNAEWKVTPGQVFSAYTINQKEILASKSQRGAYMTAAGNKFFAALEASRKTLASSLYGTGYGEFDKSPVAVTLVVGTNTMTLTDAGVMAIDIGTIFQFASGGPSGTLGVSVNTITAINGNTITFTATNADSVAVGDALVLAGSRDASGNPLMPVGLDGWLPSVDNRTGTGWNTYIAQQFYGVDRSLAPDRLAGQFYLQASTENDLQALKQLFRKCRRAGGMPDRIVMNDARYAKVIDLLTPTYFRDADGGSKKGKDGGFGYGSLSVEFSTSFLNSFVDDPYCPYEKAYCFELDKLAFVHYSNAEAVIMDGVAGNEPGKPDPLSEDSSGKAEQPYQINLEDFITIEPGVSTQDGAAVLVSANVYGTWVLYNTANSGVCVFID